MKRQTLDKDVKMTKKKQIEEADHILKKALESGFYDKWKGLVWLYTARLELRAASKELLGDLAQGLEVKYALRTKDLYSEYEKLPGKQDLDKIKNAELDTLWCIEI